jgi:hypothetical protein
MAIKFNCEKCGRKVQAPDEAGGRRGQCPFCHDSIYIPAPPEQVEEIPLAPLPEDDLKREKEMQREANEYKLLFDRESHKEIPEPEDKPSTGEQPLQAQRNRDRLKRL